MGKSLLVFRRWVSSITANDDAPDYDEHADRQQQIDPPWAVERERANRPDHEQRNADENTEIHSLLEN